MSGFLTNIWYMAAWAEEVTTKPLARTLLGAATLFFRKADGTVVAMRDRCPHRFAPLSGGTVADDVLQCPYHGLKFAASGECISNPLAMDPPRVVRVQTFPVVERDNIVWYWPGEAEAADPALIPDFAYLSDPAFKHVFGLTHVNAHYELETDNLLDLSHVEMLHPPFAGVLSPRSKYQVSRNGDQIRSDWISTNARNPPALEFGPFPTGGEPIDQWLEMRWDAPGAMLLQVAVTRAGQPRDAGYTMPGVHIVTPESERSTHYFWAGSLHAHDQVPLELFRQSFVQTFEHEDRPMIEAVAAEMGDNTDLLATQPLLLRSDGGAVLARRVMRELIVRDEAATNGSLEIAAE